MKKRIFTGAATAIVTPMNNDGSVNCSKFSELVDWQITSGIDSLVVLGTTGESPTINYQERDQIVQAAVAANKGRVPIIVGAGSNDTARSVNLANLAADCGADALLMVTPFYNKTSQKGIVKHFEYIADRVSLPIILYNVPSRTGLNVKPETYAEIAKHPNIVAVKEASGDMTLVEKTKELCGDDLDIYSGNDNDIYDILDRGGIGVISVLSNILPKETHNICDLYFKGDKQASFDIQQKYIPFIDALFSDVNPIPVKQAMNMLGMNVGPLRLPLVESEPEIFALLEKEMKKLGIF